MTVQDPGARRPRNPEVGESIGAIACARDRFPIGQADADSPELNGTLLEGGVDWQLNRPDGMLDIAAHYVIRTDDGALIEGQSNGMRHGPPEVMARLVRGEAAARDDYFFRALVRFTTGAPQWAQLNKVMAIACGRREAAWVQLDLYRLT